jgi:hypothetical protein
LGDTDEATVTLIWQQLNSGLDGNEALTFTVAGRIVTVGPGGDTLPASVTVPPNPLTLVTFSNRDVSDDPLGTVSDGTDAAVCRSKYAWLVNLAIWAVSGTGVVDPLRIVMQTPFPTLDELHPVWNPIGLFVENCDAPTTL